MPNILSKIDYRDQQYLVNELRNLIFTYCPEWDNIEELESDQQVEALVHIFSNMMEKVINTLNQALDRNLIEFLNMIGISPTPPRVAKAPLVFKLKDDWEKDGLIPSGTKVSAQPENQEEVVFETEKDLTVIKPRLIRAISIDPKQDSWSNQDFLFDVEPTGKQAELFYGDSTVLHRLYIGHSKLFDFKEDKSLLTVYFNNPSLKTSFDFNEEGKYLDFEWYGFDENGNPRSLEVKETWQIIDSMWRCAFTFENLGTSQIKTVSGYDSEGSFKSWENKWIFAQLKTPVTTQTFMPDIEDIQLILDIAPPFPLYADGTVCNDTPLEMNKDFYPFGEKPKVNDTFYISSREAFSKENSKVTLNIELSNEEICKLPDTKYIKMYWEYWNGTRWKTMKVSGSKEVQEDTEVVYESILIRKDEEPGSATTFTDSGEIEFQCPAMKPCIVNGEENYWIRIRITGGNYGKEEEYKYTTKEVTIGNETVSISELEYTKASFAPPSIKKFTIKYNYTINEYPESLLAENNYSISDKTAECKNPGEYFKPFSPCLEADPTFYMAFDSDISSLPISLFFPLSGDQIGENPIVAWEYWNGRKWLSLSVNDAIKNFTRREILQFVAPSDVEKRPLFGTENYWIRARLEEGDFKLNPKISTIYTNAVWSRNANTLQDEILGSSNGEPNQIFQLSRSPVLMEQEVKVHETLIQEEWKLWEEVKTFSLSSTDSRHYMLDHATGIITFGDGMNGMVPPAGVDNIKCNYKHGGGAGGNVQKNIISRIWDSLPGIDSVTNPIPADGGFNQEKPEEAKIRGPHTLKSWERGVTCEDIEWMVHEAAPQIAIAKCLPTMDRDLNFMPGKATVIVVPKYEDPKPVPSQELLNEIDAYLSERISAVLNTPEVPCIDVTGPDYIGVGVEATVNYTTPEKGKIIEGCIIDNLKQFFNPVHGGQEMTGWELGHNLYISEVSSVIKNTPGVDYISDISIKASVQCFTLNLEMLKDGPFEPSVPYPKYSAVRTSDNKIILALAETLQVNKGVKSLKVRGFKENDVVKLYYRKRAPRELIVVSVDGDIIECRTKDEEPLRYDYPSGSDIEAEIKGLTIRSYILNDLGQDSKSFFLKIAVPETHDIVFLCRDDEYVNTTPLKIREARSEDIFLEENQLVFNGIHFINKKPELIFPYLMNNDTRIVHDLSATTPQCYLERIPREDRVYSRKLPAGEIIKCSSCFSNEE
jgi:hypothetical protein